MTSSNERMSPKRLAKAALMTLFRHAPGTSLRLIRRVEARREQAGSILRGLLFRTQVERMQHFLRDVGYPAELRLTREACFANIAGLDLDTRLIDRYFLLDAKIPAASQGHVLFERLKARGVTVRQFVDLGANFGEYTLWFARNTEAAILAVEPSSENIALLEGNAARNGIDLARITLVKAAVADKPGTVRITKGRSQGNSIVNLSGETEEVPSLPLDALLRRHGVDHIDCLKIDIEGAEPLLLEDLKAWVPRIDSLVIEMGGGLAPAEAYDRLCELLAGHGFACELFPSAQSLTWEEVRIAIRTGHHDYLFTRPTRAA